MHTRILLHLIGIKDLYQHLERSINPWFIVLCFYGSAENCQQAKARCVNSDMETHRSQLITRYYSININCYVQAIIQQSNENERCKRLRSWDMQVVI
ncbi:hypothetical protein KP509_1Z085200 [Ceratopteris richardii]|nr:hypothetical protein KP509_1Z085200 [Ceratopteris richardii]